MNTVGEHKNKMSPEEEEYMKEFTSDRAALLSFPDIDGTLHTERERKRGGHVCVCGLSVSVGRRLFSDVFAFSCVYVCVFARSESCY